MKKYAYFLPVLFTMIFSSCKNDEPDSPMSTHSLLINQEIIEYLSFSAENKTSITYKYDKEGRLIKSLTTPPHNLCTIIEDYQYLPENKSIQIRKTYLSTDSLEDLYDVRPEGIDIII